MIDRRKFLKISALVTSYITVSTLFTGCGDTSDESSEVKVKFLHGVASGDPLEDRVIIWTRVTPENENKSDLNNINVVYEIATDKDFKNIIRKGIAKTSKEVDYTVKVDVQDLNPNTYYFYRFKVGDEYSLVGKTKTLPTNDIDKVKIALFTCSNYPAGYFNAYKIASEIEDIDVVLHVGDYIYEYGMYENDDFDKKIPAYATKNAKKIGRELPSDNNKECITLEDYRKRYALYHTDEGNQAIHKSFPMIPIWDDHEVANNSYKNGAENHQENEGDYKKRVEAAIQAYFEWLPIRPPKRIDAYRTFKFGKILTINVLETRLGSRDKQLDYSNYFDKDGNFDVEAFKKDWLDPNRKMMGEKELAWLKSEFEKSDSIWQVLSQQVIMAKTWIPAELLPLTQKISSVEGEEKEKLKKVLNQKLKELVDIKVKKLKGETLTEEEKNRIENTLPYNLDAWDGYPVEREKLFALAKGMNKRLIVFSGDSHNSWANYLRDNNGDILGLEFATTSVTSPGFEDYLGFKNEDEAKPFEQAIETLVDDVKYLNAYNRGFILFEFTKDNINATYYYVKDYFTPNNEIHTQRMKKFQVLASNPYEFIEINS